MAETVDFDLHGAVGIRVIGARPRELRAIRRQLGPIERPLGTRPPDIVIRFSGALPSGDGLRHIVLGQTAHDDRSYYLLRDDQGRPTRTVLPMDAVGGPCEIVCSRGTRGIRPLLAIINLTALWKGLVPLHGSALVHGSRGILITGWAKGGKTETLLAFREHGARYVADEWVYLDPDTRHMHGIPEPIRLWEWHLRSMGSLRAKIPAGTWRRLSLGRYALAAIRRLGVAAGRNRSGIARILRKAGPALERQLSVQLEPERLFGPSHIEAGALPASWLLWGVSHTSEEITVERTDGASVARRMSASVEYELAELRDHYLQFQYAFPGTANERIETLRPRLTKLLQEALSPLTAYRVAHPYPVDLSALYRAIAGRLDQELLGLDSRPLDDRQERESDDPKIEQR